MSTAISPSSRKTTSRVWAGWRDVGGHEVLAVAEPDDERPLRGGHEASGSSAESTTRANDPRTPGISAAHRVLQASIAFQLASTRWATTSVSVSD